MKKPHIVGLFCVSRFFSVSIVVNLRLFPSIVLPSRAFIGIGGICLVLCTLPWIMGVVGVFGFLAVIFMPFWCLMFIAFERCHLQKSLIFVLNLIFGLGFCFGAFCLHGHWEITRSALIN